MPREFSDQELVRRAKAEELSAQGIDPFGKKYERTDTSLSIKEKAGEFTKEELEEKAIKVKTAGRIMLMRIMGKASFFTIQDQEGRIQAFISKQGVGEEVTTYLKVLILVTSLVLKEQLCVPKRAKSQ